MRGLAKDGVSAIKFFKQSGARLYIPQAMLNDEAFPFKADENVVITIQHGRLVIESLEKLIKIAFERDRKS